jgi:hypothetical protein
MKRRRKPIPASIAIRLKREPNSIIENVRRQIKGRHIICPLKMIEK